MVKYVGVVLLASAALLVVRSAQVPLECDLDSSSSISHCLKQLLIKYRGKVASQADPLRLSNYDRGAVHIWDIVVRGLSGYNVDHLSVTFPHKMQIAVKASISWSHIFADASLKARGCKRFIFKFCATVRARPHLSVGRTTGTLTTKLNVVRQPNGQLAAYASGTQVSLHLASIHVKANVRGFAGLVNRILGDPASKYATRAANKLWASKRARIQDMAKKALDKVVRENVSPHLGRLLKG
nr:adult cement protein 24 [Chelonibia testudinaria]